MQSGHVLLGLGQDWGVWPEFGDTTEPPEPRGCHRFLPGADGPVGDVAISTI